MVAATAALKAREGGHVLRMFGAHGLLRAISRHSPQHLMADPGAAEKLTDAQRAFLHASDEAEAVRFGDERAQLGGMRRAQPKARHRRRPGPLLWGMVVFVLAMLGYVTWKDYDVTKREMLVFTSLAANALKEDRSDRAMRYALQAYPARGQIPWLTPFSTELEGKLAGGAQSARLRGLLRGHLKAVLGASFDFDGKRVVTWSIDDTARIWDADNGAEIAVLKGHTGAVSSAEFRGDGKRVVTASDDHSARLWDAESGQEVAVLKGHASSVWRAAFSPDGRRVVTASSDGTARIWDGSSGKELAILDVQSVVVSVAFSGDGKGVVTASLSSAGWSPVSRTTVAAPRVVWAASRVAISRGRPTLTPASASDSRMM